MYFTDAEDDSEMSKRFSIRWQNVEINIVGSIIIYLEFDMHFWITEYINYKQNLIHNGMIE